MNFFTGLTLILLTLKLTNYTDISWWVVFAPMVGSWIAAITLVSLVFVGKYLESR